MGVAEFDCILPSYVKRTMFLGHSVLAGNDRRKLYFPLLLDEKDGKDYISDISYIIYHICVAYYPWLQALPSG